MHIHNRAYCSSALILCLAAVDRDENKRSYQTFFLLNHHVLHYGYVPRLPLCC